MAKRGLYANIHAKKKRIAAGSGEKMRQNGVRSNVRFPTGASGMKKGGSAKKKKQGYKDRKDESIAMRIKKKRTKKQLRASANESYGKFGSKAKKSGKINR